MFDGYYICAIDGHKMSVNVHGFHCLRPQENYLIAHKFPCPSSSSRLAWSFFSRSKMLHIIHCWRYVPPNGMTTFQRRKCNSLPNTITKLTASVYPVFLSTTFTLLTCVTHTLPLITRSSWGECVLRVRHVSVCVFHLVEQCEVLSKFGTAALQKTLCGEFVVLTDSVRSPFYMKLNFITAFKTTYHT
jgi:hypothetical protein